MAQIDLEAELVKATKTKYNDADRQENLQQLAEAARALKDAAWNKLSEPAQQWVNDAVEALNTEQEIADFEDEIDDGDEGEDGDEDTATNADEESEGVATKQESKVEGNSKKTTKKKATKKVAPAKKKVKKAAGKKVAAADKPKKAARALDGDGVKVRIKREIMKDPTISVDDLINKIGKSAASRLTVSGVRSEFRHSLKVLSQDGHLKGKIEL